MTDAQANFYIHFSKPKITPLSLVKVGFEQSDGWREAAIK